MVAHFLENASAAERPIDDDRDAFVGCEWQDLLRGFALFERIIDLYEVQLFLA